MGPLLEMAVAINPQIIVTALMGTSVIFACFSMAALTAERGRWLYLGGTLMTLLSTLLLLSLANLLFGSKLVFQVCSLAVCRNSSGQLHTFKYFFVTFLISYNCFNNIFVHLPHISYSIFQVQIFPFFSLNVTSICIINIKSRACFQFV